MNEKLAQALDHISDTHIAEAAAVKKKRPFRWAAAVAAVLALAVFLNSSGLPLEVYAETVSEASGSRQVEPPGRGGVYSDDAEYQAALQEWNDWTGRQTAFAEAAKKNLSGFFRETTQSYLSGSGGENRVWSPVNAYIALAMLAEITGGESRQQILTALNTPNLETLRNQVGAIWEEVYEDDGHEICTLANSLWLNEGLGYDRQTMDNLAYYHYASVYQTDFSGGSAGKALRAWLNQNTGGLLRDNAVSADLDPEMVLNLVSTVYLQAKWVNQFSASRNTQGIFHAPGGDVECTFMNKKESQMNYYWGESYGAVVLPMQNGCQMWLILPDEGKSLEDVLAEGEYLDRIVLGDPYNDENSKDMKVNLSLPKFDVSSGGDVKEVFLELGITDVFSLENSNFTAITSDSPVYVTAVNQAARVIVDEEGVKAASYIEIPGAGAAAPPEEIIDFILDRPFLFVIADYSGIPLFVGAVNAP